MAATARKPAHGRYRLRPHPADLREERQGGATGWSLAYSGTIPIQNIVLSPTSMSYLRANVSLPS